ncbi:MAG: hypothetical protein ACR2GN_08380 [Bacteroidia bacterium]
MNIYILLLALIIVQFANAQTKDTTITGNEPADSSTASITFSSVDKITLNLGVGVETSGFGMNTSDEALDYIEEIKNNSALRVKRGLMPIGLSATIRTIIK